MKNQKKHIYNVFVVGGFLLLGIMASPPHQQFFTVWLLVAFGILQLISAELYRSTVKYVQKRITVLYNDFEESSKQWKEMLDFQESRVQHLKVILNNHHISIGESI